MQSCRERALSGCDVLLRVARLDTLRQVRGTVVTAAVTAADCTVGSSCTCTTGQRVADMDCKSDSVVLLSTATVHDLFACLTTQRWQSSVQCLPTVTRGSDARGSPTGEATQAAVPAKQLPSPTYVERDQTANRI